jgi:recombination DNA repair RAD52 pathway protein
MNSNTMQQLGEQFPKEVERQLKKGGTTLTYIPVSEVINRLNKVLGFDAWSYEIIKCERDALDPDFIVAHVRMTVYPDSDKFVSVVKDGFGGQKIKRTKNGDIVDLGDEFKGAVSDALKKAAQSLGVGLYLARSEEAMDIEEALSITPQEQERLDKWEQFASLAKALNAEQKTELNEFWEKHAGGRPKPTKSNATDQDLDDLIAEIVRIQLGGTLVSE